MVIPHFEDFEKFSRNSFRMSALIAFVLTFTMLVFFLALLVYCKTKNCNKSVPQIQDGDDRVEAPMVTVILPERNEAICLQTANESREIPVTPPPSYEQAVFVK
jgi:cellulose synthase/poly-beta-1,6-N-acetylglucosamine synthase-like glycosyltransferase